MDKFVDYSDLSLEETNDGSISLRSKIFKESFHSNSGAYTETIIKFINPSEIKNIKPNKTIYVLDICLGLGYNIAALIEESINHNINFKIIALEIDNRTIKIAINQINFRRLWSDKVIDILSTLVKQGRWHENNNTIDIIWDDARVGINKINKDFYFDLIYLDSFSPRKCPELWSYEFIKKLGSILNSKGRIITYCTAAAVRNAFLEAGLEVKTLIPEKPTENTWSIGTVALVNNLGSSQSFNCQRIRDLTEMEKEHLRSKAGIPYRDLSGKDKRETILERRENEQQRSTIESTSKWRKRWI